MRLGDRPLFWGICIGIISGDWELSLALAIVFELLWLDVLALGSVVPPYGTLSFLLVFPLAELYGWHHPAEIVLPATFAMVCAHVPASLEQTQRDWQNIFSEKVLAWCKGEQQGISPGKAIIYSVLLRACGQYALYVACFLLLAGIGPFLSQLGKNYLSHITWGILYAAAIMGAVLGLRIKKAYPVFVIALFILGLLMWLAPSLF